MTRGGLQSALTFTTGFTAWIFPFAVGLSRAARLGQRSADPCGVRADQVQLQPAELVVGNPHPRQLAETNAAQVAKVRSIIEGLSLEVATPDEARDILSLKGGDMVDF